MLPGILLVALFMGAVAVVVRLDPKAGPAGEPLDKAEARRARRAVWPVLGLCLLILGGIDGKVFTPAEASGVGAVGAAAIAFARGRLRTFGEWRGAPIEATRTTATLFIVIFGALIFAQFINLSGLPYDLVDIVDELECLGMQLVIFVAFIVILMGMIFESIGILLLRVPIFLSSLFAANVDMIWFGIIVVLVTELGLITPPIGMNVFVVRSVLPDIRLGHIFRGVVSFIVADLIALVLVFLIPAIAVFLPALME